MKGFCWKEILAYVTEHDGVSCQKLWLLLLVSSALLHCEVIYDLCVLAVWNLFWYWGFDSEPVAEHCPSTVILVGGFSYP